MLNEKLKKVRNLLFFALCLVFFSSHVYAQKITTDIQDEVRQTRIDSLFNDLFFGDDYFFQASQQDVTYQLFYLRSNFDSKTFFAGREIGMDQHNMTGQLYYLHSNGIFVGVSGAWYSQLDPGYRTTVLSLGYSKSLKNKKFFRYRFSYDYYLFNSGDIDFDPLYTSSINVGTTLKSETLGTRFDVSFLLGKEIGKQLSWDFYGKIKLLQLGIYDRISLEPEASLYFGSETVEYQFSEVIIGEGEEYYSFYKDVFGLMNIQMELPLNIYFKNFDLEAAWIYNFPKTMDDGLKYEESSFFRVSLGYFFQL